MLRYWPFRSLSLSFALFLSAGVFDYGESEQTLPRLFSLGWLPQRLSDLQLSSHSKRNAHTVCLWLMACVYRFSVRVSTGAWWVWCNEGGFDWHGRRVSYFLDPFIWGFAIRCRSVSVFKGCGDFSLREWFWKYAWLAVTISCFWLAHAFFGCCSMLLCPAAQLWCNAIWKAVVEIKSHV